MLTPQKAGLLQAYLGSLPANLAARLAKAVEVDRLTDGAILPHELILDGLRPVLSRGAPQRDRTPTPLRLFCRPFEDILTSAPRSAKQKGRIARTSIMPVWNWVTMKLIPKASHAYVSELKSLLVSYRADEARERAILFWTDASAAIRDALSTDAGRKEVEGILKDRLAVADAGEMALLLSAGAQVLELQDKLPKPIPSFTPDLVSESRAIYDRLIQSVPDAAPYVVVIVMNRLARRWEALRLTVHISRKARDTLIASTDVGLAGDLLFADLDALSQAVRSAKHPRFDAEALVENVASFAELSSAIVKELELRRDGRWGQSLLKDRAEIGAVMDAFMERAPKRNFECIPDEEGHASRGSRKDRTRAALCDAHRGLQALRGGRLLRRVAQRCAGRDRRPSAQRQRRRAVGTSQRRGIPPPDRPGPVRARGRTDRHPLRRRRSRSSAPPRAQCKAGCSLNTCLYCCSFQIAWRTTVSFNGVLKRRT